MPERDDNGPTRLFVFRAVAMMALVVLFSTVAIYQESQFWTTWSSRVVSSAVAISLFAACYLLSILAQHQGHEKQMQILLWIEASICLYLLMTAREINVFHYFSSLWIARLPHTYRLRTCLQLCVAMLATWLVIALLRDTPSVPLLTAAMIPVFLFVLSVSFTSVNESRLRRDAVSLAQELRAAQDQLAQMSRQSERLRISRDIHDLVGHQMTALLLNLEVATHKSKDTALPHVLQSQTLAKQALGDLRNAVSELRDSPTDFRTALDIMLMRIPELNVHLDMQPDIEIDDPRIAEILLRCIQEALTNTLRHARATKFHVRLYLRDKQLTLEIGDDGTGVTEIVPGNGLRGMQERLQEHSGTLQWQVRDGGLTLLAHLPLHGVRA